MEEPTPKADTVVPPTAQMSKLATVQQGGPEPGRLALGSGAVIKLLWCGRAQGTCLPFPASPPSRLGAPRAQVVLPMSLNVRSLTKAAGRKCACLAF